MNIICEKEEARYILLARNFLFFRSTSFALYREEDRVEDEGLENQKHVTFKIFRQRIKSRLTHLRKLTFSTFFDAEKLPNRKLRN